MLKKQRKLPCYNDGVVRVYREKNKKATFGAKENVDSLDDLDFIIKLDFSLQSIREQDFVFAEQRGFNVASKVRTHLAAGIDAGCKAVIGDLMYDISYVDRTRSEMFLFLEGGMPFEYVG